MQQIAWNGPKKGQEHVFPINLDLTNILGRTELDFENLHVFFFDPTIWQVGPGLGRALYHCASLQLSGLTNAAGIIIDDSEYNK